MEDVKYLWEIMITGAIAVIGFFGMRTVASIDEIDAKVQKTTDDLHDHKTHVAEVYETKDTIKRIHDRIDALGEKIDAKTNEITTLILQTKK
jgi:DNA-binding ferritin-like protein